MKPKVHEYQNTNRQGMSNYEEYLEQNNYSKTTIEHYLKRITEFTDWSKKYGVKVSEIDYKTCLKYVKYLQQKRIQVQTINNHIVTLRNYFDYLIETNKRAENPIEEVSVKKAKSNLAETR